MFGLEASSLQQASVYDSEVHMGASRGASDTSELPISEPESPKTVHDLHPHLEATGSDGRPDRCSKPGGRHPELPLPHGNSGLGNPCDRPPPTCVHGSDRGDLRVVEQDRNAVSHPNTDNQPSAAGPQAISLLRGLGGLPRDSLGQLNPVHSAPVDLGPHLKRRGTGFAPPSEATHSERFVGPGWALGEKINHSPRG